MLSIWPWPRNVHIFNGFWNIFCSFTINRSQHFNNKTLHCKHEYEWSLCCELPGMMRFGFLQFKMNAATFPQNVFSRNYVSRKPGGELSERARNIKSICHFIHHQKQSTSLGQWTLSCASKRRLFGVIWTICTCDRPQKTMIIIKKPVHRGKYDRTKRSESHWDAFWFELYCQSIIFMLKRRWIDSESYLRFSYGKYWLNRLFCFFYCVPLLFYVEQSLFFLYI